MEQEVTQEGLSIGALARATGLSVHSLRMWERRYGSPESIRRPSGHRRYPFSEVHRLRAVARALSAGIRASEVVSASIEDIDNKITLAESRKRPSPSRQQRTAGLYEANQIINDTINRWCDYARAYDERRLTEEFMDGWTRLGPMDFICNRATPFLKRIGDDWQCGDLCISHEHLAAQRLSDFLNAKWRSLNAKAEGPPFIFATLAQDSHQIGLQMAAIVTALEGRQVLYFGTGMPEEEIIRAATDAKAKAVGVSISSTVPTRYSVSSMQTIRHRLPAEIAVICGGVGAPPSLDGVQCFTSLVSYQNWLVGFLKKV